MLHSVGSRTACCRAAPHRRRAPRRDPEAGRRRGRLEGGDPGASSACIASKVIAGMHQERVALSRSSSTHELAGARDPILYALTHLRDGTGSIDAVQHDLPLLCLIVHELLLQDLARLRDAGRAVRLVCRWAESRTRLAGARLLLQLLRLPQLPFGLRLRSGPRAHATSASASKRNIIGRAMPISRRWAPAAACAR